MRGGPVSRKPHAFAQGRPHAARDQVQRLEHAPKTRVAAFRERSCRDNKIDAMPMIRETIVTTADRAGRVHIAPIGIIADGEGWIIAPFRPSATLDNLRAVPFAVANYTDDVRVFAGCLTGRELWPTTAAADVPVPRLAGALAHAELAVVRVEEDDQRPRFHCRTVR